MKTAENKQVLENYYQHKQRMKVLEKYLGDAYYHTGDLHAKIDDTILEILENYKQPIIDLIDERMKQDEQMRLKYIDKDLQKYSMAVAKISAYHELKQKIEEL